MSGRLSKSFRRVIRIVFFTGVGMFPLNASREISRSFWGKPEYVYLYVCDADGMIPKGTLLKLLRKAEHPDNRDIAIFQAFTGSLSAAGELAYPFRKDRAESVARDSISRPSRRSSAGPFLLGIITLPGPHFFRGSSFRGDCFP